MTFSPFPNPFRPGAGHPPPYLAGRATERDEFAALLGQGVILDNLVLTGLRGVGKTVLLEAFKPIAHVQDWLWVGTDLSESASISEASLAIRLLTDLSVVTSGLKVGEETVRGIGFMPRADRYELTLTYDVLHDYFDRTPGLIVDKLKAVFALVAAAVRNTNHRGFIFAYDEAQNLADHAAKEQYPLSLLLDLFQSVQRAGEPFLLVLSGLPTLFPKLVEARTYAERMFRVLFLHKLTEAESREAILRPIQASSCPVRFKDHAVATIYRYSGGYPYFIQFLCRESYDAYLAQAQLGATPVVPIDAIIRKLDTDFFAGRWGRVTERQRDLLFVIANLDGADDEFTVQDILTKSAEALDKPFSRSHINQILNSLIVAGLVYRDRHGRYLFAVPLMADFIRRTMPLAR